jgi:HD-like signal output (HDOD) protein
MNAPNSNQTVATQLDNELSSVKIPPRPAALASIENEMRSKAPNFGAMAMLISVDVGISASLLKIANSAYFGQGGRVRSVSEALQILGLNTVASSIAALSLRKVFAHVPNLERYWDSSARVALLSGWLVTQLDFPYRKIKPEEAYTFGLFRDCGIPILMSMYADYFDILERANSEVEESFTTIEVEAMGLDHAMIGGSLAKEWHLPIEFKAAIELHHDADAIRGLSPHIAPDISRYFIAIAQLSEYLYQRLSGLNKTQEWRKLGAVCLDVLGIQEKDTDQLFQNAQEKKIHAQPAF